MLFEICFAIIVTVSYWTYQFLRTERQPNKKINRVTTFERNTSINDKLMSNDKFIMNRWKKQNNTANTASKGGLFGWKRNSDELGLTENVNQKKYKTEEVKNEPPQEIILLSSDDESDVSISVGLNDRTTFKDVSNKDSSSVLVFDFESQKPEPKEENQTKIKVGSIPATINSMFRNIDSNKTVDCSKKPDSKSVPNPPGMPPVISGVPVRFPVTPYRSQVSVMNAVIKGCKNKEHCLLESPTGSGKTLALLCAALAWQEQFKESVNKRIVTELNTYENGGGVPGSSRATPAPAAANGGPCSSKNCDSGQSCKRMDIEDSDVEPELMELEGKPTKSQRIPKIYYGSRTHKQIEQVIREFRKTAYTDKPMTILSSRELTCIQGEKAKGISKTQLCNDLRDPRKRGGCAYYNDSNKSYMSSNLRLQSLNFETPWDIEDLVQLGRMKGCCPYFAARSLMEEAEIIFCPYNYLIDPAIRDTMSIDLSGDVVIIDEAHNMESICRDVGSASFREDHLKEAIDDCECIHADNLRLKPVQFQNDQDYQNSTGDAYLTIVNYLTKVLEIIHEQHLRNPDNVWEEVTSHCWTGLETWTMFQMHKLGEKSYSKFKNSCNTAINQYKAVMEDLQSGGKKANAVFKGATAINFNTKKLLEQLMMSLECIQNPVLQLDYRCTVSKSKQNDAREKTDADGWTKSKKPLVLNTFKFMCMNSAIVFSKVAKEARTVVLASGTLSPTMTFESELGVNFAQKLSANHVVPKDQVYVRGISHGPSGTILRATYQNVQTLPFKDDLGKLLVQVCQTIPYGVLCFFSSYSMMTSQIERWRETGVLSELERVKLVLQEPRHNNELDEVMQDYRNAIHDERFRSNTGVNGALLMAVFRGKVAEGIDFSDNEARCVISIGIPYPVQTDPVIKLKREYNDRNRDKGLLSGSDWYSVQAFRALNQGLGRCIRHKDDWGAVLLIDERLNQTNNTLWTNYLPKWIREMKLQGSDYDLKDELKMFVKNQELRDEERDNQP